MEIQEYLSIIIDLIFKLLFLLIVQASDHFIVVMRIKGGRLFLKLRDRLIGVDGLLGFIIDNHFRLLIAFMISLWL